LARDFGLEELVRDHLGDLSGLSETSMFGGRAWLLHGNLLCAARDVGILARLGAGNDAWAIATPGIAQMTMGKRVMSGWVRASQDICGDDALRARLLDAALAFGRTLPPKA
jgi:hypothetical protein